MNTKVKCPRISVVTTFHRQDPFLFEAINSVLTQTYEEFEYLLIIDGNPDAARWVRQKYADQRLRVIEVERLGLIRCRNLGLQESRAPWVAILDSDDVCQPTRLERQLSFLEANTNTVVLGSSMELIDSQSRIIGERLYPTGGERVHREMPIRNCLAHSTVMIDRKRALECGGYRKQYTFAEDYDLWLRMGQKGKLDNLPEKLIQYRIHPTAAKATLTRKQLRDTLRLRSLAVRRMGYPFSIRYLWTFAASLALLAFPSKLIYRLFTLTHHLKPSAPQP